MKIQRRSWLVPVFTIFVTMILSLMGLLGLRAASARSDFAAQPSSAITRLLDSEADGLRFVLEVPIVEVDEDGSITAPGLRAAYDIPGAPELPAFSTYIALPPGAKASVEVQLGTEARQYAVGRVRPAPQAGGPPEEGAFQANNFTLQPPIYEASSSIYDRDALYPGELYRLSDPMYYRDLRLVRLDLYPLQYNPVQQTLEHAASLEVSVNFSGADWQSTQAISDDGAYLESIAPLIINFDRAREWRSLPQDHAAAVTVLPTNQDTFKIDVDEDGIYEVKYTDLLAAGMDVGPGGVDPNTFAMMYRGQPVAYEFVGNDNATFESHEKIRFYGWAFDGSRLERQFLTENVFWLWAQGAAQRVALHQEASTANPVAATYRESITREPDTHFTHVWTDNWENSPNEPDAWIWDRVHKRTEDWPVIERVHEITLPTPAQTASMAQVTVEILSRESRSDHDVSIHLNANSTVSGTLQWTGARSVNVTVSVPVTQLLAGINQVHVLYHTPVTTSNSAPATYYMNRITVDYDRRFITGDEQLIFSDGDGNSSYQVGGFSNGEEADAIVWEISDRLNPEVIILEQPGGVLGNGPYTYTFGTEVGSSSFIATHVDNVRQPLSISKYVGPDLDAPLGASWLVVSHANFLSHAEQLATHRRSAGFGGYSTHVVDVQHVINQYGYGLPLPGAIRQFLQHALTHWPVAPQHLLLFGDGHINPRQLPCSEGNTQCEHWATSPETNYVLTDIVFTDQFVGINASDYSFSLLVGDDLLPDLTVGRLAVQSSAEAQNIVNKIVHYETARLTAGPWQRNVLFVADNTDTAGDFCAESTAVANTLPQHYITHTVCLPSSSDADILQARTAIDTIVNNPPENGVTFLNYRGHGAVRSWAGSLINLDDPDNNWTPWFNNEPLIILSMDCLDGHFAQPGYEALSEEFLAYQNYGSAAHWSSTGFGYDFQHDPLHHAFYAGLFDHDLTAIGDAVNFAKLAYFQQSHHPSQLFSFTLQGDPAMEMIETGFRTFLPALKN